MEAPKYSEEELHQKINRITESFLASYSAFTRELASVMKVIPEKERWLWEEFWKPYKEMSPKLVNGVKFLTLFSLANSDEFLKENWEVMKELSVKYLEVLCPECSGDVGEIDDPDDFYEEMIAIILKLGLHYYSHLKNVTGG